MAKSTMIKIKLQSSADTGYFYVTKKNSRTKTEKMVKMNEALILGSVRQHELTEAAEILNAQLEMEISARIVNAMQINGADAELMTRDQILARAPLLNVSDQARYRRFPCPALSAQEVGAPRKAALCQRFDALNDFFLSDYIGPRLGSLLLSQRTTE